MIEKALSSRGRILFIILAIAMMGYITWHRFAETGIVAWVDELQASFLGGYYSPEISFMLLIFPIIALACGPAFLHDYIFQVGVFSPEKDEEK